MSQIRRIFVEKKNAYNEEAANLLKDLRDNLGIKELEKVRILKRYDIDGLNDDEYRLARNTVLSEPPVDTIYDGSLMIEEGNRVFAVEYLPGQYDQRADSAAQCIQILTLKQRPLIKAAQVFVFKGGISDQQFDNIKNYLINPVDSCRASLKMPRTLEMKAEIPPNVEPIANFIRKTEAELEQLRNSLGLAMSPADLAFCQTYFRDTEKRDPTITEVRMLDTYWSDHCRHTTFHALLENVDVEPGFFTAPIQQALDKYNRAVETHFPEKKDDLCLMNLAVMSMKEMRALGKLEDLEVSGEVNACSIVRDVVVGGQTEKWLVMFKNETHNHPTEIEPFGGAATCLGGAIRDPLSGRAYVYQAMRVTGSGNPLTPVEETLPGKLPQRKITTEAAHGYSSYGNQIGLPTGLVSEFYDEGYLAKRMEVGAVVGAVPRKYVVREEPEEGDLILFVGGRTGRDGIGGATGSSKEHTEESIHTAGAEVQKGNPPEERKLLRLFRNPLACRMIKKCNDFGAGGVSVAIGELADGLEINLDTVPKKYDGLDGTELALSESQERMAVVVAEEDALPFIALAARENLEATVIARVTEEKRLKMHWRANTIVDMDRDFIDSNGVRQKADATVVPPDEKQNFFKQLPQNLTQYGDTIDKSALKEAWLSNLGDLNVCSRKGLTERFDNSVGAGSVFMPFGGKYQLTPMEGMGAKIPTLGGGTLTCSLMSHGFYPALSRWSPFHGAVYAVVEAVSKIVAMGGDYATVRLSLQEYFEKLGQDPVRWGKPFSALLGAYHAMTELEIAAIGGKDSMSGSFKDLDVPPTLIAFAVDTADVRTTISPEFKRAGTRVVYVRQPRDECEMPLFDRMKENYAAVTKLIKAKKIAAAHTVGYGGLAAAVSKMAFGNKIGFRFTREMEPAELFAPDYGSLVLGVCPEAGENLEESLKGLDYILLGETLEEPEIQVGDIRIGLDEAIQAWEAPLEPVFPMKTEAPGPRPETPLFTRRGHHRPAKKIAKPRVLIPVFPGTNCEYDTQWAFELAGAEVEAMVFRNLTPSDITESLEVLRKKIDNSQILVMPGGFSAGDEPDGSGKFIAAVFRNPHVKDAVLELLKKRDGLMLGICNGFQALLKLGLLPYGDIHEMDRESPTVTFNQVGRLVSTMSRTRVTSVLSPWFLRCEPGEVHTVAMSHGEGRFVCSDEIMQKLVTNGQVTTQYVDDEGKPSMERPHNPNGAAHAVEGICSPDGRILGKMGHSERMNPYVFKNIPGEKVQNIFASGVEYFS